MARQRLLIDGYNLLWISGNVGRGRGTGWLERARRSLLHQLERSLPPDLVLDTLVVFDTSQPSPSPDPTSDPQPRVPVEFAMGYASADERLIEHIRRHPHPRKLVVVSSDHAIQNAARRRRATVVDSDVFWDRLLAGRIASLWGDVPSIQPQEPKEGMTEADTGHWIDLFLNED
ncbi:MAG: hypothetical protein D6753_12735 [Planctomycetota bacterium]|nr:MAG: hypothetical protein D6753_12735 [Planctomycetota bacterium]